MPGWDLIWDLKCKNPKLLLSGVIFKFTCQCDADVSYIGETKRHMKILVKEHLVLDTFTNKSQIHSHLRLSCKTFKKNPSITYLKCWKDVVVVFMYSLTKL